MKKNSSAWTPDSALAELGIKPTHELSFAIHVKLAYRRACKKWHPDHFVQASAEQQKVAEETFKRSKQAYEYLEVLDAQGQWPRFSTASAASTPFSFTDFSKQKSPKNPPPQSPTPRGSPQPDPDHARQAAARIFSKWPKLIAESLARADGLDAAQFCALARKSLAPVRSLASAHPEAFRHEFLQALWSAPTPGLARAALAGCHALRREGMDWAADICSPLATRHTVGSSEWTLFDAIAQRCQSHPPTALHQEALLELARPGSPLADPTQAHLSNGAPLMARLLEQAPWAAELLAGHCPKGSMASEAWLDRALSSRADPRALAPWFEATPLATLLLKTESLADPAQRQAWTDALAGRIHSESIRPGHQAHAETSRFNQSSKRLADIERALNGANLAAAEAIAAYDPAGSMSRKAFSLGLSGDRDGMLGALAGSLAQGIDATSFMGMPIACALACKAARLPKRDDPLILCIDALPQELVQARDGFGLGAAQWLDAREAALLAQHKSDTPRSARAFDSQPGPA